MKAIVVVDLQRAFAIPRDLRERIEERLPHFPVRVFTQFVNPEGSLFRSALGRNSCSPGDAGTQLLIRPGEGDLVLTKSSYGLSHENVIALRELGVDEALVCGMDTDACVLAVMFNLFDGGIRCELEPRLCWSSGGLQSQALAIIREQFKTGLAESRQPGDPGFPGTVRPERRGQAETSGFRKRPNADAS